MQAAKAKQYGASLIEVLVTLLVFTVGLLGFAALQLIALQNTSDSAQRSQATWVLQELAERIRANPQASTADYLAGINCADLPARICSDHLNPLTGSKVSAEACDASEMASFDRWEAQCSYGDTASYQASAIAGIARYTSRDFITPPDAGQAVSINTAGNTFTLTANWLSKGLQENQSSATSELSSSLEVVR